MTFDAIVAGAGIWGCTVARRLADAGRRVLVIEKRAAVGGNCRCKTVDGIEVHLYGSHIFHTSDEEVWAFVRRFTEFNDYRHCVLARTKACGREEMGVGNRCTRGSDVLVASDAGRITSNWYDVIDPETIENMDCIKVSADENPPTDRRAIKDVFQGFGVVENANDGRRVIFPAKSAGKMLGQSGIDIRRHVRSFAGMFRKSIRAWSEKEAVIESHKQHRNITAYHQYIVKAELGGSICYIRFTVREDAGGRVRRNEVHSSTISRVTVYKAKGAELSGLGHAQVEDSTPFVDNKVTFFLNGVKGGGERSSSLESKSYHTYHLPIGKTLLEEFFGVSMKDKNLKEFLSSVQPSTSNLQPQTPLTYGDAVFDAFIRGYTSKQWGVAPEKVDPSIIARLKVRDNYSTDYFDDPHQGIPSEGYNKMFKRMLDHPNITVRTNSSVKLHEEVGVKSEKLENGRFVIFDEQTGEKIPLSNSNSSLQLYYSGPIDALFNYRFGHLPWRTLRFEEEMLSVADFQGNSVVNYTDANVPFTRIHEFKHYHPEWDEGESVKTIIMREYSDAWQPGDEPYYPIDNAESRALLARYQEEVDHFNQTIKQSNNQTILHVGGRLGAYKYYDMDKSVADALAVPIE